MNATRLQHGEVYYSNFVITADISKPDLEAAR